jgi:hypothetical protein
MEVGVQCVLASPYVENDATKALSEVLLLLDHVCIQEKILKRAGGQYLMRASALMIFQRRAARESESTICRLRTGARAPVRAHGSGNEALSMSESSIRVQDGA